MYFHTSWLLNWGLRVGGGFSYKRESAKFKQQIQEMKDRLSLEPPDSSEDIGPEGVHLTQEEHDTGVIIATLVHNVLLDLVEQARKVGRATDGAKTQDNQRDAAVDFSKEMDPLVARTRNTLLTLMATIKRDDVRALSRLLRALDKVEEEGSPDKLD